MKRKRFFTKIWRPCLPTAAVFFAILLTGCQTDGKAREILAAENSTEDVAETTEETSPRYHSDTPPEDCFLCGDREGASLSLYQGQKNLGVINLNSLDLSPISINRYDDFGVQIEESVNGASTYITNTGKDGFFFSVTPDVNRGYAHGDLSFNSGEVLDMGKVADNLCSDCLNRIMENCWSDTPWGVGVIDFSTNEIHLFEEKVTAFTFGDYYISCRGRDGNNDESQEISLLVFYCPERYQD